MIQVPQEFKPVINTVYPPNNFIEYERWFGERYNEEREREYLGVYWCAYQVNNDYGNDIVAMSKLQKFIDSLPRSKKYFTISQYDDSVGVDFKDLDVLQFNMSTNDGIGIPLMCQPHPFKFKHSNDYIANFIGNKTHPIRNSALKLINNSNYYVSFNNHDIESYCRIISKSTFTLCFRGYGKNSFRVAESMQFGSIPVVITDEFVNPFDLNFNDFGVIINSSESDYIDLILTNIDPMCIINKQDCLSSIYNDFYTYEGCYKKILTYL